MCKHVKLSIELAHGDGLGVQYIGVHLFKRHTSGGELALQSRESISKYLIALCFSRYGRSHQHEAMANHSSLVELDAFFHKTFHILQTLVNTGLLNASLHLSIVHRFFLNPWEQV